MNEEKIPSPKNPERLKELTTSPPEKAAGGIPAVISSLKHILSEMNFVRGAKALFALNQKDGFDCPSCAWPDPDDERSGIAEYCENGAKAVAEEATTKKLTPEFFAKNSVYDLSMLSDFEIGKKGRIAQPMYLPAGATHYEPIRWDDAFNKIAAALKELHSPDEAIFYTSGRTSNEAAFLYQLFVRELGTNNLPDCSNMCHESSGVALRESIGIGKGTVTLEDFYTTEVIIIIGQNPGTNAPRMLSALRKGKDNGAKIIAVNPMPETGLMGFNDPQRIRGLLKRGPELADIFLQIRVNQDMAFIKVVELLLLNEEEKNPGKVFDSDFIKDKTSGYDEFVEDLRKYNVSELSEQCGISLNEIKAVAEILKSKTKIITAWSMGLTQHKNAVNTIQEIVNLHLLKGSIGKPGAGLCPVRGHSNVQGDRTMGINEQPPKEFLDSLQNVFGFSPPRENGYDVVDSIKSMYTGKAKVFFGMGGNFLTATPDTEYTARALMNCKLTVQVSTKLNRSHLIHGKEALILPVLARSDKDIQNDKLQFLSCENSMGIVQSSQGVLKPVSDQLLSEPAIVCRMAKAVLKNRTVMPWDSYEKNYDLIRDAIEKTIPGFENYNERVRAAGGFYLPNAAREQSFITETNKANFQINPMNEWLMNNDELVMITIRSHDQFNTTIYGLDDRYRGIHGDRRVILLNKKDMERRGLNDKDIVNITSMYNGEERKLNKFRVVEYPISEYCAATYYPETNALVAIDNVADKSGTPVFKTVRIRVVKAN